MSLFKLLILNAKKLKLSKLVLTVRMLVVMTDHEEQMYQLQSLLDQLPEINRETLKKLTAHLLK